MFTSKKASASRNFGLFATSDESPTSSSVAKTNGYYSQALRSIRDPCWTRGLCIVSPLVSSFTSFGLLHSIPFPLLRLRHDPADGSRTSQDLQSIHSQTCQRRSIVGGCWLYNTVYVAACCCFCSFCCRPMCSPDWEATQPYLLKSFESS